MFRQERNNLPPWRETGTRRQPAALTLGFMGGFWRSVFLGRPDPVTFAASQIEVGSGPTFEVDIDEPTREVFGIEPADSPIGPAPRVNRKVAIQCSSVASARRMICTTLGGLPLDQIGPDKRTSPHPLFEQPERNKPRSVTLAFTAEDLLFEGVAWWRITEWQWNDYPKHVRRVHPSLVQVNEKPRACGDLRCEGKVYVEGKHVHDRNLIRFDSPNDALLVAGARAIRTALKLAGVADRNSDGVPAVEYFHPVEGADPVDDEDMIEILNKHQEARRRRLTGFVPAALELKAHGWNPEQLQLVQQYDAAVKEIARHAGLDPEDLGVSTTSRTYQNQQDRRKEFVDFTLGGYRQAIEERLSMGDVTPRGYVAKFNLSAFLRSDDKTRMETYKVGLEVGAITKPEIRDLEDKPPLDASEQAPQPEPQPLEEPVLPALASHDSLVNFDAEPVLTFDAPSAPEAFSVDREKRVIRGLAVPYGAVSNDGRTYVFSKGSITFSDPRRIKLLIAHDWGQAVGHATTLEDTDAGLLASFKVARGPEGDRALSMAEDGVWDGLSVGIGKGMKTRFANGQHHVLSAPLREVSQTPCPAYDGARITEVAASHEEGTTMLCDKCGQVHAEGVVECQTPGDGQQAFDLSALPEQIAQAFMNLGGQGPEVVPAGGPLEVTEPAPYRFDGTEGEHDFSSDLFASIHGDSEAKQRVQTFMEEAVDPATFAVGSADVSDLNPPRNRPDMYVDRLVAATPLWLALRKGSLSDNTPFIFPKFVSASDLVDDHVEMVEPTPGSFAATKQTVTPSPLSGKVEIPREVVDAGGNPQVSRLIWREMERSYYEALEGKVAAMLAASNPTAIALTAGAEDANLVDELEAAYAALQFIPGGFRFDYAPTHQGLYQRLAAASDSTGRKLLPIVGATNANGGATTRFASLNVAGVQHLPVASLGAAGTGVKKSYLLASEDVHAWASPPRELRFEYQVAHVDMGIWGYVATAISRLDGVRVINYNTSGA